MLPGQQIGPFEIEKELGSGAMGTVWKAKFRKSDTKVIPVALKMVALGLIGNEGAMARFEREAAILKQLSHPHIVKLHATGTYRRNPFIAMEFIDGEALDRVLARRGKLSWEEVLTYGKQLCEALQYAHDKGIIHRDLKPSNLMITKEGVLKLTDFGIAKDTDVTALTGANSTIGTAAYMSPEQCKGDKNLSNKSDLYSLGIVFFELLTGRKPFMAETTVEMFLKHVNEKAPRIGKIVNDLPPKFEALILQLLEKDKDVRPIDAAWVGRMLQEVEEDQFARKSAGLVKAQGRSPKLVNQSGERMDAEDKEAARALRGRRKKRKPEEPVPFFQQKWVKAVGIIAILAGIAVGVYFAVKPPSQERMYAAIEKADKPEDKVEAAARFLDTHGDKGGDLVDKAAQVFREQTVKIRERQLAARFHPKKLDPDEKDDTDAYNAAFAALGAERDGQLEAAITFWNKVKNRFPEEAKMTYAKDEQLAKAKWGWLADKRLADIAAVKGELIRLDDRIKAVRPVEQALPTDPMNPESLAIRALRLRAFGDHERAYRVCETITGLTEKDPDKRVWFLVGAAIRNTLNKNISDPYNARVKRITEWLNEAGKEAEVLKDQPGRAADRRDVRNKCRDVTELYDDDTDPKVAELVKDAKKIADKLPK